MTFLVNRDCFAGDGARLPTSAPHRRKRTALRAVDLLDKKSHAYQVLGETDWSRSQRHIRGVYEGWREDRNESWSQADPRFRTFDDRRSTSDRTGCGCRPCPPI